ncbi:A/G-specific adenine glycosylase [Alternaria panax]|uniref:Adenine DNA glycosylase n=1 Tax=Alternaria panax TaxID=48097 RepID=A0AAD4III3_9PLEO|nr:A/G-specific adenine glycosylase [Alternaria panax]
MAPHNKTATAAKPRKTAKPSKTSITVPSTSLAAALPPSRVHDASYHYPLLLSDWSGCDALLSWFSRVADTRSMPWRKKWIDPEVYEDKEELGRVLSKRAYEVWVSEVMLQQTRVSTVIPYFNNWIAKWPTVQDLAEADHDDVLSVWKGLGYYSRATRLHEGAKAMIAKSAGASCALPSGATELQGFPGIGRYTAGAVSSIAFGEAEPVLDGNVMRVLSRQLGLYMDVKDKKATDIMWDMADQLIKHASDFPETRRSAVPGLWNQALMELGSTVCTPRPKCDECPIQASCRAYSEGKALSDKRQSLAVAPDIEDACSLCASLDTEDLVAVSEDAANEESLQASKKRKVTAKQSNKISQYFAVGTPKSNADTDDDGKDLGSSPVEDSKKRKLPAPTGDFKSISTYCSLFPKKVAKKKAAEEDCVVCMVELCLGDGSSKWLIEQRPAKGLLASLWQFPQSPLTASQKTPQQRKMSAQQYISCLDAGATDMSKARYVASFPPLVHVFTHLKLTMHAYQYRIDADNAGDIELTCKGLPTRKWVDSESMDKETLSTGMRKCWDLVSKSLQ